MITFEPTWASLKQFRVPAWYRAAKFGIFIHWGIYSVPAFGNEWYPRNMYRQGSPEFEHHVRTYGAQSAFGYKDFIPQFTGEHFDAEAWMQLFMEAGARYIVPVAEHHDGFAMYDSALSDWTAVKMGPKRDVIGELAAAAHKFGLTLGVSNHRAEHWWFFDGGRAFDSDVQHPANADLYGPAVPSSPTMGTEAWDNRDWEPRPDAKFLEDWLARNCELIDKYQPQVLYFDWWIEQVIFQPYLQRLAAYYYNRATEWQVEVAINYKHLAFPDGTAVMDLERGQLTEAHPSFWQTDTSISNNSWGYVTEQQYTTANAIIGNLIDIVSKNGTLLLNIGPRPDGTIPQAEQDILREIGSWLAINGEAIYDSYPWKIYGEGPTEVVEGQFQDIKRADFTSADVRFTTRDGALYAIVLAVPTGDSAHDVTIKSLKADSGLLDAPIADIRLIGHSEPVAWTQTDQGLRITLPATLPNQHALVFKLTFHDR